MIMAGAMGQKNDEVFDLCWPLAPFNTTQQQFNSISPPTKSKDHWRWNLKKFKANNKTQLIKSKKRKKIKLV